MDKERERVFYEKPALQFVNLGGVYQMVGDTDKDYEAVIWHEHLHSLIQESLRMARQAGKR